MLWSEIIHLLYIKKKRIWDNSSPTRQQISQISQSRDSLNQAAFSSAVPTWSHSFLVYHTYLIFTESRNLFIRTSLTLSPWNFECWKVVCSWNERVGASKYSFFPTSFVPCIFDFLYFNLLDLAPYFLNPKNKKNKKVNALHACMLPGNLGMNLLCLIHFLYVNWLTYSFGSLALATIASTMP